MDSEQVAYGSQNLQLILAVLTHFLTPFLVERCEKKKNHLKFFNLTRKKMW